MTESSADSPATQTERRGCLGCPVGTCASLVLGAAQGRTPDRSGLHPEAPLPPPGQASRDPSFLFLSFLFFLGSMFSSASRERAGGRPAALKHLPALSLRGRRGVQMQAWPPHSLESQRLPAPEAVGSARSLSLPFSGIIAFLLEVSRAFFLSCVLTIHENDLRVGHLCPPC